MLKKIVYSICLILIYTSNNIAQVPTTYNSSDIFMQLKKLKVLGSVLYIAAHPDDENNSLLPYLAKEKMYRTAYLSLTRGDGGQNLIGPEQGIELGLIRTQELLAARKQDGSEQYFTTAYEFGYSKNAAETFSVWKKEKILADVVWVIRQYQPDVIIARFPTDGRGGHGHHTASAILAEEAYAAAADSTKFPEQFKEGVTTWQAKRMLWNTFNFGGNNTTSADQFKLSVNNLNPFIGKSYGEIGAEARTMHKSQGEGRSRIRGERFEYFSTIAGEAPQKELLDGVNISWQRIDAKPISKNKNSEKTGEYIDQELDKIIAAYNFEHPELSVPNLVKLYSYINTKTTENSNWNKHKLQELQTVIEACSGLFAEATTTQISGAKDDSIKLTIFINKRNTVQATLQNVQVDEINIPVNQTLANNSNYTTSFNFKLSQNTKDLQPYWLSQSIKNGQFIVTNQQQIGKAINEPMLIARFSLEIEGVPFTFTKPVQYKYTDLVKGELYQPFIIIPKLSIYISPSVKLTNVINDNKKQIIDSFIQVIAYANFTANNVPVTLFVLQEKVKTVFENQLYSFEKDKQYIFNIPYHTFYNAKKGNALEASIKIKIGDNEYVFSEFLKTISYDHIPNINYYFKDHVTFINEPIKTIGKKIGYINGAGDVVVDAIKQLGFSVDILTEKDITLENLNRYDAIVTGIRAYNIHEYLTNRYEVLMAYVQQGGNLIVQYLRNNLVGTKQIKVAPFNFTPTSSSRITEENAPVNFLLPNHSLLNYPNKIIPTDFDNWVQERSTYQAENFGNKYEALFSMNDNGEKPTNGSLITTKFGKGNFTYISLVLFRQLPAGIGGAYKILANAIALGKE